MLFSSTHMTLTTHCSQSFLPLSQIVSLTDLFSFSSAVGPSYVQFDDMITFPESLDYLFAALACQGYSIMMTFYWRFQQGLGGNLYYDRRYWLT